MPPVQAGISAPLPSFIAPKGVKLLPNLFASCADTAACAPAASTRDNDKALLVVISFLNICYLRRGNGASASTVFLVFRKNNSCLMMHYRGREACCYSPLPKSSYTGRQR